MWIVARHLNAATLRRACRANGLLQRACGKRYWRTLCCITATARAPEACVTWSQRKNVQMGSMRQRVSLCSNTLLQLATSLEKRTKGKEKKSTFRSRRRETENYGERGYNPPSSIFYSEKPNSGKQYLISS